MSYLHDPLLISRAYPIDRVYRSDIYCFYVGCKSRELYLEIPVLHFNSTAPNIHYLIRQEKEDMTVCKEDHNSASSSSPDQSSCSSISHESYKDNTNEPSPKKRSLNEKLSNNVISMMSIVKEKKDHESICSSSHSTSKYPYYYEDHHRGSQFHIFPWHTNHILAFNISRSFIKGECISHIQSSDTPSNDNKDSIPGLQHLFSFGELVFDKYKYLHQNDDNSTHQCGKAVVVAEDYEYVFVLSLESIKASCPNDKSTPSLSPLKRNKNHCEAVNCHGSTLVLDFNQLINISRFNQKIEINVSRKRIPSDY
jgi:hypothetical protein